MGYLVVRGEETHRIFLDEIALLIVEKPAISITGSLLNALTERKIRVVFCDNRHLPSSELMPCYGSHDCVKKLRNQVAWTNDIKAQVWNIILSNKIYQQELLLRAACHREEAEQLAKLRDELLPNAPTNREGHGARVYFRALFGTDFTRQDDSAVNNDLSEY